LLLCGRCEAALQRLAGPAAEQDQDGRPTLRAGEALLLSGQALVALNRRQEAGVRFAEAIRAADAAGMAGAQLLVRAEAQRGENLFRMAEAARASDPAAADRHLSAAADAFRRAQRSPAGETERCEARLWAARVLGAQRRFEEAGRVVAELMESMLAREALGRDQLHCLRGEFLLEQARRTIDQAARGAAARAAVEHFGLARAAAPAGPLALRSTLGAAEAYRLQGNDSEANSLYEEVLAHPRAAEDPGSVYQAVLGVAEVLRASGRHRRAAELLRSRLLETKPGPIPQVRVKALRLLATSLAVLNDPAGSARAWGELATILAGMRDAAGAARARLDRALQLGRTGDTARAAAELEKLAAECPADLRAEVQLQTGRAFEVKGDDRKALEFYVEAGGARPEALVAAAELELRAERFKDAQAYAQKAQKEAEKARKAIKGGSLLEVRAVLACAHAMVGRGVHQEAADRFRYAADLARRLRSSAEGRSAELEGRRGLAAELAAMGRHADAASCYLQAAYLVDERKPAPELLELAASALDRAGQARAAAEVRRLAAARAGK
jgi:tetratricopeptide (TPR) repeat protein